MFALYLIGFVLGGVAADRSQDVSASLAERIRRLLAKQPAWLDLFATHDLVPAGPLIGDADYVATPAGFWRARSTGTLDSLEIVNGMQTLTDHTSYWGNADGFIDRVIEWLRRELHHNWLPQPAVGLPSWCRRRFRTRFRSVLTGLLWVEVLALWWRARHVWQGLLPTAETTAQAVANRVPAGIAFVRPLLNSGIDQSYNIATLLLGMAVHVLALAIFSTFVLGRVGRGWTVSSRWSRQEGCWAGRRRSGGWPRSSRSSR